MTWFRELTFGELLDTAADRWPDRPALTFGGESVTFGELRERVDAVAAGLIALGVESGDIVAVWMPNRPEWVVVEFAVAKVGAALLPINTALRSDDCSFVLGHSECRLLVIQAASGPVSYLDMVRDIVPEIDDPSDGHSPYPSLPALRHVVVVDGDAPPACLTWSELVESGASVPPATVASRAAAVSPRDRAIVMYTSGTTGHPKGVTHSHHAIRNVVDEANRLAVRETDVILMYLPLFHAYGLYEGPLLALVTGARCVLMERFDPALALRSIEEERATLCFGFSTHFQDMLDHPDLPARDLGSLRAGILAVGPTSMEDLARRVQRSFPGKIVSGYGMTEIGVGATLGFLDEDEDHSAATSGYPLPGYEIRVVDPDSGAPLRRGEAGEVLIRSYQVTEGYLKEPEKTAETIDGEGWLHSGDMGVLLDDGYLRILGRYKDMLRVGGENVDPAEVEALYLTHPAVQSAVLVGVPDPRLDEVACLCLSLASGHTMSSDLESELLRFADGRLAPYKRPRYLHVMDAVPMTASGKVQRHIVRDGAVEALGLA